jgi:hypothetical protein
MRLRVTCPLCSRIHLIMSMQSSEANAKTYMAFIYVWNYVWLMVHHGFHYPLFLPCSDTLRGVARSGCIWYRTSNRRLTSDSRCEPTSRFRYLFAVTRCVTSNGPLRGASFAFTSARRKEWLMCVHSLALRPEWHCTPLAFTSARRKE